MGEIVNLNRARKRLARAREALDAKQNRVRFGRTIVETTNDHRRESAREALLDGKLPEPDDRTPS